MEAFANIISLISGFLYSYILIALLIAAGLYFTIKTGFIQFRLFGEILENFGIKADTERIHLFTNLSLTVMVVRRAIPHVLPLFVTEAADATVDFQINAIVDAQEQLKTTPMP